MLVQKKIKTDLNDLSSYENLNILASGQLVIK